MKLKDIPAETNKRIIGLEKKKAAELAAIADKINENNKALAEAKKAKQNATESTDLTAYQDAKKKEAEANAAIEMYAARYTQLERREFVTMKDSDATIDALLQYEADIAAEYIEVIAGPIAEIKKAHADYTGAVKAAEGAIEAWTHRIHANYRASGTTYADGTNISKTPVPVRRTPYSGSKESIIVGQFLEKISNIIAESGTREE